MDKDPNSEKLTGASGDRYDKRSMGNDREEKPVPLNPDWDDERQQTEQRKRAEEEKPQDQDEREELQDSSEEEQEDRPEPEPLELQKNGKVVEGKELSGKQLAEAFKAIFSDWLGLPAEQAEAFDEDTQKIAMHVYSLCKARDDHLSRKGWVLGYISDYLPDSKDKDLNDLNKRLETKLVEQYKTMTGQNITDADIREAKDVRALEIERQLRGKEIAKFVVETFKVSDANGESHTLKEWEGQERARYWEHDVFDGREGLQFGLKLARFADIALSESAEGKWNETRLRNQVLIWDERIDGLHAHTEWCEKQAIKQRKRYEKFRQDLRMTGTGNEPDREDLRRREKSYEALQRWEKRLLLARQREDISRQVKQFVLKEAGRSYETGEQVYNYEKIRTGDDFYAPSVLERRVIDQSKLTNGKFREFFAQVQITLLQQQELGANVGELYRLWQQSERWQQKIFKTEDAVTYQSGREYSEAELAILRQREKLRLALIAAKVDPENKKSIDDAIEAERVLAEQKRITAEQKKEEERLSAERLAEERRQAKAKRENEAKEEAAQRQATQIRRQGEIQQEVNTSVTDQREVLAAIDEQRRILNELREHEPDWNKIKREDREQARQEWLARRDEALMRLGAIQNKLLEMDDPKDFASWEDRLRWVREKDYAEVAKANAPEVQKMEAGRQRMEESSKLVGNREKVGGVFADMTAAQVRDMPDSTFKAIAASSKAPEIEYLEQLTGRAVPENRSDYTLTESRARESEFRRENEMADYDLVRELIIYSKQGRRNITKDDVLAVSPRLTEMDAVQKAKVLTETKLRYHEYGKLTESQLDTLRSRYERSIQQLENPQVKNVIRGLDDNNGYTRRILAATYVMLGNNDDGAALAHSTMGQPERPHEYFNRVGQLYADVLRDDAVVRKIFYRTDEEESRYFESEFYRATPHSIEDMAWQIAHAYQRGEGDFGRKGKYATYKKRIMFNGDGNNLTADVHDVVNTANMTLWLRSEVDKHYQQDTESAINFFEKVQIDKGSRLNNISIQDIINAGTIFFTSKEKDAKGNFRTYNYLNDEWQRELTVLMVAQRYRVELTKATDEEQIMKLFAELTATNVFTKRIWGASFFYWLDTMSSQFYGADSDGKLGGMINTLQQAHFHLANAEALKNVFGLKKKEDLNAIFGRKQFVEAYKDELNRTRRAEGRREITTAEADALLAAEIVDVDNGIRFTDYYDTNGDINDFHGFFSQAVNIWGEASMNHHVYDAVRRVLRDQSAKMHRVDDEVNKGIGQLLGTSMAAFEGAWVHNDPNGRGYKPEQRVGNFAYRLKQGSGQRGGRGNYYMLSAIRNLYIPPMYSLHTEKHIDGRGQVASTKALIDVMEEVTEKRIEVNNKIDALEDLYGKQNEDGSFIGGRIGAAEQELFREDISEERRRQLRAEIEVMKNDFEDTKRAIYEESRTVASQFEFKSRSLERWWADCARRAYQLEPIVGDAQEFDFANYMKTDQYGDTVIEKAKFQADFVKRVITPLRYLLKSYGELNYNQPVWWYDPFQKKYRNMTLLEVMLGPELFEREVKTKDGAMKNMMKFDSESGKWAVDTTLVNDNPEALLEQAVGAVLVATWLQHIDRQEFSTDPRYESWVKMAIRDLLKRIPKVTVEDLDPTSMKDTHLAGGYFSDEAFNWMMEHGNMTIPNIFNNEIGLALFSGKKGDPKRQLGFEGWFEMLGVFISEIAKSH